ncbi:hypothetical protein [Mesorhizobium sp. M0768]|uniref:hypothetical protein n=1 Tax=unclassified Mesorhizobium TaxID=325217 RepID=UPI0033389F6F
MTIENEAASEAVARLGLLKPEAAKTISRLLLAEMGDHPRAICTAYRKNGVQISREEKKALGIRVNAFLSYAAFNELSEAGKGAPLSAHETTLLRATFSVLRYRAVEKETDFRKQLGACFLGFEYDVLAANCPTCIGLNGTIARSAKEAIFPNPSCTCVTANYGLRPKVDWLADVS